MKRVGITGGIGSGKSTVVEVFRRKGVECFLADNVAATYYENREFLQKIRILFGDKVFAADGSADKRKIADIVFADPDALARLNGLVHPRVMADFEAFCEAHSNDPYVLFESAILYESGIAGRMDSVVCVYLDRGERIRRLRVRDGATDHQIEVRMAAQQPAEQALFMADYVILNYEGNPREQQVDFIDQQLRQ